MSLVRLKGTMDKHGRLTVQVPWRSLEGEVEVFVTKPTEELVDRDRFLNRLEATFGMDPSFERPHQGAMPPAAKW